MKRKYWILLTTCFSILFLDQWTKYEVVMQIPFHHIVPVVDGFFNLTHLRNRGGAFGIFSSQKDDRSYWFFIIFSLIAIGAVLLLFMRLRGEEKIPSVALSLVMGGALGNLIDRLRYGEVIDFLDFYISSYHWPAFNIADSSITIGIGLFALELIFLEGKREARGFSKKKI